ncbi:MAG TPA: hypothetical protein VE197_20160 [Mycobacterium sp.]|nr:hypothetical protein [Mycobacterium sp.]
MCAAVASASGCGGSADPPTGNAAQLSPRFAGEPLPRAQAPTQLAAAVMLASGGALALTAPRTAVAVVIMCIVGTVAAGSWQSARYAVRRQAAPVDCAGNCAVCIRSCR